MISDEELKIQGVRALVTALGDFEAARFVSLMSRPPFDYTEWQRSLGQNLEVDALSRDAMKVRPASGRG